MWIFFAVLSWCCVFMFVIVRHIDNSNDEHKQRMDWLQQKIARLEDRIDRLEKPVNPDAKP